MNSQEREYAINEILDAVRSTLKLNFNENSRKPEFVKVRQMAYLMLYESKKTIGDISLMEIDFLVRKKRDHATVLYGIKTIRNIIDTEKYYKDCYLEIKEITKQIDYCPVDKNRKYWLDLSKIADKRVIKEHARHNIKEILRYTKLKKYILLRAFN